MGEIGQRVPPLSGGPAANGATRYNSFVSPLLDAPDPVAAKEQMSTNQEEVSVGRVVPDMAVSLGGFVAGPNDEPGGSHDRFFPPSGRRQATDAVVGGQRNEPEPAPGPYADLLLRLSEFPPQWALPQAAHLLSRLTKDPGFLRHEVIPLLGEARSAGEWYVARRHDAPDGSYSLQGFVWPPGTGTRVHDHSSWGAYRCVVGSVLEERYERLDDGSRHGHARLREVWRLTWTAEDGVSTVSPGGGGIHRVSNPNGDAAVSVHLYGPRLGEADGRDYDPARDHVCDRRD